MPSNEQFGPPRHLAGLPPAIVETSENVQRLRAILQRCGVGKLALSRRERLRDGPPWIEIGSPGDEALVVAALRELEKAAAARELEHFRIVVAPMDDAPRER